jgi:hypothetical protein
LIFHLLSSCWRWNNATWRRSASFDQTAALNDTQNGSLSTAQYMVRLLGRSAPTFLETPWISENFDDWIVRHGNGNVGIGFQIMGDYCCWHFL